MTCWTLVRCWYSSHTVCVYLSPCQCYLDGWHTYRHLAATLTSCSEPACYLPPAWLDILSITRLSGGFCSTWITFPKILMKKVGIRIRIYLFFLYALLLNIKARSLSKCVGGKVNYLRYHKKRYRTGFSSSFFVTWLLITLFSRLCS